MSIEKQGMQAQFMQQAWILGSAFFFRHDHVVVQYNFLQP